MSCFPIQFMQPHDYDFGIPGLVNFTGNAIVVGAAGLSTAAILHVALRALGFSSMLAKISITLPLGIGIISGLGAAIGATVLITGVAAITFLYFTKR